MIYITGASGKTGRAVIRHLAQRGTAVRALIHRREHEPAVREAGAAEVQVGDLRSADDLRAGMHGARAIYHICPNMTPDEVEIGQRVIAAARQAGVELFGYHSVLHPQVEDMPHHWQKLRVEELLFQSGLGYVILQPAAYMQNILGYWESITQRGVYPVPYAVETRLGMVDLEDVAEAAARVLTEPAHAGGIYELSGSEALTQGEVAEALSRALGRPVQAQAQARAEWERGVRAKGMAGYSVDTLLKMFTYYERYGFWGSPTVLTCLLGRAPATFASFLERTARAR